MLDFKANVNGTGTTLGSVATILGSGSKILVLGATTLGSTTLDTILRPTLASDASVGTGASLTFRELVRVDSVLIEFDFWFRFSRKLRFLSTRPASG